MNMFYEDYDNGKKDKNYKPYCVNFKSYEDSVEFIDYLNSVGFEIVMHQCYGYHTVLVNFDLMRVSGIHMPVNYTTPDKRFDYEDFKPILQNFLTTLFANKNESVNLSPLEPEADGDYKKLYYENKSSTTKIYPYHVIIEREEYEEAVSLLESLGFKRIKMSASKSADLYVNLELKRFSSPHVAFWYMGSKRTLIFNDFKSLLEQHSHAFNPD